jgi:hypothetical protein
VACKKDETYLHCIFHYISVTSILKFEHDQHVHLMFRNNQQMHKFLSVYYFTFLLLHVSATVCHPQGARLYLLSYMPISVLVDKILCSTWLCVHYVVVCTLCGCVYAMWLCVHYVVVCTLCGCVYAMWLCVRYVVVCTLCGCVYTT